MSDRIKALTVTLRPDMRDDDAGRVAEAIRLLSGVVDVRLHVADMNHHVAVETAKRHMQQKIKDIVWG